MKVKNIFEEEVFYSTVRVAINTSQGASIGTGFIAEIYLGDKNNNKLTLLISNKHVFHDPANHIFLNFHKLDPDDGGPLLGEFVSIEQQDFSHVYWSHPNPNIDLACINISSLTHRNDIHFKNIPTSMFATFDEDDLIPGASIWFVGYPENRFDVINNLPLLRRGYISSVPRFDFNGEKQFIVDAQVYPGSSGSPCFAFVNGSYKLLGIVTATMIKHEMLQSLPSNSNLGIHQTLGLGIVLKTTLLEELFSLVRNDTVQKYNLS
ncbi:serine protease [Leptospira ognonensis]|uniref:Serine protease n=1 Tax=Leptospira ognonensis TaxID=2484945 RepID=A0A4R9K7D5_9LEPT|nr:serine protease [Leptospira ognonensis]TGL61532.1 serine protease [Leptospira ognonensis]